MFATECSKLSAMKVMMGNQRAAILPAPSARRPWAGGQGVSQLAPTPCRTRRRPVAALAVAACAQTNQSLWSSRSRRRRDHASYY